MKQATASASPSSTTPCPSSRANRLVRMENGLPKFARLKKVLTTSID